MIFPVFFFRLPKKLDSRRSFSLKMIKKIRQQQQHFFKNNFKEERRERGRKRAAKVSRTHRSTPISASSLPQHRKNHQQQPKNTSNLGEVYSQHFSHIHRHSVHSHFLVLKLAALSYTAYILYFILRVRYAIFFNVRQALLCGRGGCCVGRRSAHNGTTGWEMKRNEMQRCRQKSATAHSRSLLCCVLFFFSSPFCD